MPNGGSDCCGTCWFNSRNKGEAGRKRSASPPEPSYCIIRELPIRSAFYTYCANHPRHNPGRIEIPIGPVREGTSEGYREVWKLSPDTEEIRLNLLNLLSQIQEQPNLEYPIGIYADDIIIWQVGEFREARALEELRRISAFLPEAQAESDPFKRRRHSTVSAAFKSIGKIEGSIPLDFPDEPSEKPHPSQRSV
jgi:hypothetical protein